MNIKIISLLLLAQTGVFAEVATSIPVADGKNEFRVNTADYYSWNTRTEIYAFKYVKATEFSHVIKNCVSAYGKIQINDKLNMVIITDEPNKLKDILVLCDKLDKSEMNGFEKIQSETIPILYSKASNILPFVMNFLSIEGSVKANDVLNFIAITDHPDVISRVREEVKKFDLKPKQIEFKFHVVEVKKINDSQTGTNWDQLFNIVDGQANYAYAKSEQNSKRENGYEDENTQTNRTFNGILQINPRAITNFIKLMVENKTINLVADNTLLCVNNNGSTFSFRYQEKTIFVSMKPTAINEKTLLLRTKIVSNGDILLENSTISEIGKSNLLLRMSLNDSELVKRKVPILGNVLPFVFSMTSKGSNILSLDIVCTPTLVL